jgi:Uma2 family endonuclease
MNAPAKLLTLDPPVKAHKLSFADYQRMAEAGILTEDSRVELIEGVIVDMSPIGSHHAGLVGQIVRLLAGEPTSAMLWIQSPIRLGNYTEPEPDIVLLKPRNDFYKKSLPQPEDILLLIEVADSSVDYDRKIKIPLYAEHGVPEVWLIDLNLNQIEIYLEPSKDGFRKLLKPAPETALSPTLIPEITLIPQLLFSE